MYPMEAAVAIVAMVLGYKLLSQLIRSAKTPANPRSYGPASRHKRHHHPPPVSEIEESPQELIARAEEMQRRIRTLEEIIESEKMQRSGS